MEFYRRLDVPTKTIWTFSGTILDWQARGYEDYSSYVYGHPSDLLSVTDSKFIITQDSPYEHSGEILLSDDGKFKINYSFGPNKGGYPAPDQEYWFYITYDNVSIGEVVGGGYWIPYVYFCFEKGNDVARLKMFRNSGRWPNETNIANCGWNSQLYNILEGLYPNYQAINYITGNNKTYNLSKIITINFGEPMNNAASSSVNLNNNSRLDNLVNNS